MLIAPEVSPLLEASRVHFQILSLFVARLL